MNRLAGVVVSSVFLGTVACGDGADIGTGPADTVPVDCGDNLLLCGQRLNIAHRGGGRLMPEETLAAYANAVAVGADLIEMDLHTTSDGVPVCLHDVDIDRTTDGTGPVNSYTFTELQEFDAGYNFNSGDDYPERGQGHTIPSLEDVLTANSDQWILIEIKQSEPPMVDEVIAVLDATGMAGRVAISSFKGVVIQELREKRPDILSGFSMAETIGFMSLTEEDWADYDLPARVLQPPHASVDAQMVKNAEHFGVVLQPWTVNKAERMQELLEIGVQGVMTDDPLMLEDVITKLEP